MMFPRKQCPDIWTGEVIAALHCNGLRQQDLAAELGVSPAYVCMVLAGKKTPAGAEARFKAALSSLIQRKEVVT